MDILAGTVPFHVFVLCMVKDVIKHVTVHHVIIAMAVMSHWIKQVIITDEKISVKQ